MFVTFEVLLFLIFMSQAIIGTQSNLILSNPIVQFLVFFRGIIQVKARACLFMNIYIYMDNIKIHVVPLNSEKDV